MKLHRYKQRKNGREYEVWSLRLSAEERRRVQNLALEYELDDVDPKGWLILKAKGESSTAVSSKNLARKLGSFHTSFRLHVSEEEYDRFKELCRSRGLTTCRVISNFIRAALVRDDGLLEPGSITIESHFYGRPRGPSEKIYG